MLFSKDHSLLGLNECRSNENLVSRKNSDGARQYVLKRMLPRIKNASKLGTFDELAHTNILEPFESSLREVENDTFVLKSSCVIPSTSTTERKRIRVFWINWWKWIVVQDNIEDFLLCFVHRCSFSSTWDESFSSDIANYPTQGNSPWWLCELAVSEGSRYCS